MEPFRPRPPLFLCLHMSAQGVPLPVPVSYGSHPRPEALLKGFLCPHPVRSPFLEVPSSRSHSFVRVHSLPYVRWLRSIKHNDFVGCAPSLTTLHRVLSPDCGWNPHIGNGKVLPEFLCLEVGQGHKKKYIFIDYKRRLCNLLCVHVFILLFHGYWNGGSILTTIVSSYKKDTH